MQRHSISIKAAIVLMSVSMAVSEPALRAQRADEYERIRIAAIRLQQENDSLRLELRRFQYSAEFSSWDRLTGMDPDIEDGMTVGFGANLSSSNRDLMSQIHAACPSIGKIGYDKSIREQIELFTDKRRKTMSFALARYREYFPRFSAIFKKYDVPEDVAALVIVESAVSVKALSPVGAAGMWQLMPETAVRLGLRVDNVIDERYDPVSACDAAARYLRNMHGQFGSWILAVAAYNCGAGNVRRALFRAGANAGLWDVVKFLPAETRGYVPAFIAARYTLFYANELEFARRKVAKPLPYRVRLAEGTDVPALCDRINVPVETFMADNPHILNSASSLAGCFVYVSNESFLRLKQQN